MKRFFFIMLILSGADSVNAQVITQATIGSSGGQLRNGNIRLNFTIGETIVGPGSNGTIQLGSGFWTVVPVTYTSSALTVYRFVGDGNFSDAANWLNNQLPPNPLPSGSEIIIDPSGTGQCILNTVYTASPGSKFSVFAGKRLLIPQNLTIQ